MTAPETLVELAEELEELARDATARPWTAFDCGSSKKATLALMKGRRPPSNDQGYPVRRWQEIIAWAGFDASDVPLRYRRANLHLIVALVNALPEIIAALRAQAKDSK